jgi:hypothetical protein
MSEFFMGFATGGLFCVIVAHVATYIMLRKRK